VVAVAADRLGKIALTGGDVMIADKESEVREAWRAVANAKLVEYRRQSWRLAHLARQGKIKMADATDGLWEIAIAHALVRALGEDRVQAIIAEAFAGTDFGPMQHAEVA
jgi:hypothetical protein